MGLRTTPIERIEKDLEALQARDSELADELARAEAARSPAADAATAAIEQLEAAVVLDGLPEREASRRRQELERPAAEARALVGRIHAARGELARRVAAKREELRHARASALKAELRAAYDQARADSKAFATDVAHAGERAQRLERRRERIDALENELSRLLDVDEDGDLIWPEREPDEPDWPELDIDRVAALAKAGPRQPNREVADYEKRRRRETENRRISLIREAEERLVRIPRGLPDMDEAFEATLRSYPSELHDEIRRRVDAAKAAKRDTHRASVGAT